MRILKTAECPSLSGRSTLTYNIGCENEKEVFISLVANSGPGIFNKGWIEVAQLDPLLSSAEKPITSGLLHALFNGKSANSAGFLLAVLIKEGLIKISKESLRCYERIDPAEFKKTIQELIDKGVSVDPAGEPVKGKKPSRKPKS